MTTFHTPSPWRITGQSCRDYEAAEIGTGNKPVAVILTADAVEVTEEDHANARRICAAVNACEGIHTEALERDVVMRLMTACQLVVERWEHGDLAAAARACSDVITLAKGGRP
jgi:hypothetical protein